jgi:hypothetical protein
MSNKTKQTNSGALVRQRTIPTERPPLVGEVSANFNVSFKNLLIILLEVFSLSLFGMAFCNNVLYS